MRILHLSDTHLGVRKFARGAPPRWSRAADHHQVFREALAPARWEEVDLVVHSGDLFNRSRPPRTWAQKAIETLCRAARRVPVVVISGNHDRRGLRRHLPTEAPGLTVVDTPTRLTHRGVALGLVPFRRRADDWATAAREAVGPGVDLLVTHQAFDGARVPGLTFRVGAQRDTVGPQHLPPGISHVLCGHIHPRQVIEVGPTTVVHAGSTERTSFSECRQTKGTVLWDLGERRPWRYVDHPTRPMVVVTRPDQLGRVRPESLVNIPRRAWTEDLEQAVMARGGWVVGPPRRDQPAPPPPPRSSQLGLFMAR